jgi:hypothetical protein
MEADSEAEEWRRGRILTLLKKAGTAGRTGVGRTNPVLLGMDRRTDVEA